MAESELDILKNIQGIEANLRKGTRTIKEGHLIQGLNPDGLEVEVPLTRGQIQERLQKLTEQQGVLNRGYSRRKAYPRD